MSGGNGQARTGGEVPSDGRRPVGSKSLGATGGQPPGATFAKLFSVGRIHRQAALYPHSVGGDFLSKKTAFSGAVGARNSYRTFAVPLEEAAPEDGRINP